MLREKGVYTYLALTALFSTVFYTPSIISGQRGWYVGGLMWCPGLAAMATCRLLGRPLSSLGWRWPAARWAWISYAVPVGYAGLAYGAVWALRLGGLNHEFIDKIPVGYNLGFPWWGATALYLVLLGTVGMTGSLSSALGEEIGWRGFLVPELAKEHSFTGVALISGLVWAVWHAPLLLFSDYNAGTNRWYALGCFTVSVISAATIMAWLRLRSGSLWTGALVHASHNLFVQRIFDGLMRDTGKTRWYTTEFGCALAITTLLFALVFWAKGRQLLPADGPR
jgi:membrane protease YdiL (CAAX protease family)